MILFYDRNTYLTHFDVVPYPIELYIKNIVGDYATYKEYYATPTIKGETRTLRVRVFEGNLRCAVVKYTDMGYEAFSADERDPMYDWMYNTFLAAGAWYDPDTVGKHASQAVPTYTFKPSWKYIPPSER